MDKNEVKQKIIAKSVTILLPFIFLILIIILLTLSRHVTASSTQQAYDTSVTSTYESTYNSFYKYAEKKNHVSNKVDLKISDIEDISDLEVYTVADTVFLKGEKPDDHIGTLINGHAYYTVNLSAGEFLVDNQRNTVYIRIPKPELGNVIIENNRRTFEFKNKTFLTDGSDSRGSTLAREFERIAKEEIYDNIKSNTNYLEQAKKSAVQIIEDLVIAMNPDIENPIVKVSFYN